jgi:hypothetical protein
MGERDAANEDAGERLAQLAEEAAPGILGEYWNYLRVSRKWWLTPIVIALLIAGAFVVLGGTAAAPFIYAIF